MQTRSPLMTLDLYIAVLFGATVVIGGIGLAGLFPVLLLPLAAILLTVALLSVSIRWAAVIVTNR